MHEKYREFGGPDGGDGGNGGNVIFRVSPSWNTLYYYKTHRKLVAQNGEEGKKRKKHGANAEDLIVDVPVGTMIYDADSGKLLADLGEPNSEAVLVRGGEGGFGNAHFTSSVRQTPRFAELGTKGEKKELRLELKLVADVALVGLPNIGKSTLLSVISSAKPKIADYEFTTLVPNLGVVEGYETPGFVVADLPGLIEGAAQGKGLGDEFLRHIERTRLIIHLLDGTADNLEENFEVISREIEEFDLRILEKPQVLAITKSDLLTEKQRQEVVKKADSIIKKNKEVFAQNAKPFLISSITHDGVADLVRFTASVLANIPKALTVKVPKVYTLDDAKQADSMVKKENDKFVVSGPRIDNFAAKTDFSNPHAVARIYDIITRMGLVKKMEKLGAHYGDKIVILDKEIDYKG